MDRSYIVKRSEFNIYSELGLRSELNTISNIEVIDEDTIDIITEEPDDNCPIKSDDIAGYVVFIAFIIVFIIFTLLMMYVISKYSTKRYVSSYSEINSKI